jgi:FkbM family methyltransferase
MIFRKSPSSRQGAAPAESPAEAQIRTSPAEPMDWALLDPRQLFSTPNRAKWENDCRRLTFNAPFGKDSILCRILARYKMVVSAADEGLAPHLIGDGFWEIWITRFIADTVKPGMVCIDAGANVGYYTVLMGDLAGPMGKVIAAEPIPDTHSYLTRNVRLNGFDSTTQILPVALGAQSGEVILAVPRGEPKNALVMGGDMPLHEGWQWDEIAAPMLAIDDLDLERLDFIKIDVEGAELDVWAGMQRTIARSPDIKILMEVNCGRYSQAQAFIDSMKNQFQLRAVDYNGHAVPISDAQLLDAYEDVMVYLSRS